MNIAPSGDPADFSLANGVPLGGREWWVFGMVEDAPQWGDDLDITINWGDGSDPTILNDLASPAWFDASHNFEPTGQTYTVSVTARDDDTGSWSWSDSASMYLLDLDNALPDSVEHQLPGEFIFVNDDDDNENEIPDYQEIGTVTGEDDLKPFYLAFTPALRPDLDNYDGWFVALTVDSGSGTIWESADRTGLVEFVETPIGFAKVWEVGQDTIPGTLYLEAIAPSTIGLSLGLYNPDWFPVDGDPIVFTAVPRPKVDLDTDSDNTGEVERSASEDADELVAPGNIIHRNWDDDDLNGVPDYSDSGPLIDPIGGGPLWDNDIELLTFEILPADQDLAGFTVTFTTSSTSIKLWKEPDKEPLLSPVTIGTNPIPPTLYVEGIDCGQFKVFATLRNPAGSIVHRDTVLITVVTIDAVPYRQQTPMFTLVPIAPPHLTPAAAESAENSGVGIRRNGDDDNNNATPDRDDLIASSSEDDLIRVDLNRQPASAPGVGYKVSRSDTKIRVYGGAEKGTSSLLWSAMEATVTWQNAAWVEWVSTGGGTSTFEFSVWDATHNRKVFFDQVVFKPFNSVVIVPGGNLQTPGDPNPSPGQQGIFDLAIDEYRTGGRDVYMYAYSAVATDGQGEAYNMVVSAINERGVTDVAIMGYSWGGGATYALANRLELNLWPGSGVTDITNAFSIPFTGYIDGIRLDAIAAGDEETRHPALSQFHCAQYELNSIWPHGAPSGGDDDIDRSYLLVSGTTDHVDHYMIDDHLVVLGWLKTRLHQFVTP